MKGKVSRRTDQEEQIIQIVSRIDQEVWITRNRSIGTDQEELIKRNRLRGVDKKVQSRRHSIRGMDKEEWIKKNGSRGTNQEEGIKRNVSRKINQEDCDRRETDQENRFIQYNYQTILHLSKSPCLTHILGLRKNRVT